MKKALTKIAAALAATTLASGMIATTASAYNSQRYWNIFVVLTPYAPGQHSSYTTTMPTYGGGYIARCNSISGSYNRYVSIYATGLSWLFTNTGTGSTQYSNGGSNGKITFYCYGNGTEIVANGDIGYNM